MRSCTVYSIFFLTLLPVIISIPTTISSTNPVPSVAFTNKSTTTSTVSSAAFTNKSTTPSTMITTTLKDEGNAADNADWVVNSGMLAMGISPIKINPVCYTGDCRSSGFGIDIFKFDYTKRPVGTCTTKLIPQHVTLTCIEASDVRAKTEKISNYDELKESYSKGSSSNDGLNLGLFSFQYGESEQTTTMIDNIYIYGYTLFYTYAIRSVYKLTSNTGMLELSDAFRTAIEQMPCCSNDTVTVQYINNKIFPVFGYAYMSEIDLGGIAQVLTTIETNQVVKWEQEGYKTSEQSGFSFIVSFGKQDSEEYNKETYSNFTRYVKNIHASTMGGQPFDAIQVENEKENSSPCSSLSSKLNEWMQSVSRNPVIIKFNTLPIQNLLTPQRFNSDPNIENKAKAIEFALQLFISENKPRCFHDCSGNGECQPSPQGSAAEQFNHGICICDDNFSGPACAKPIIPTAPVSSTSPTSSIAE